MTDALGLESAGVQTDEEGFIEVDDCQQTSADNVYAVGDVTGRWELTPVCSCSSPEQ